MPNATLLRSKQQADLLQQLEKAGAPIATTSSDSLEALKSNSRLAEDILGLLKNSDNFVGFHFDSAPPKKSHERNV